MILIVNTLGKTELDAKLAMHALTGAVDDAYDVRRGCPRFAVGPSGWLVIVTTRLVFCGIFAFVNLAFSTQEVRRLCENEAHADCVFGIQVARALRRRLADLAAIEYASDVVAMRAIETAETSCMRLDLGAGACLVFCANHNNVPLLDTGEVAWDKVDRIKILSIEVANE